MKVSESESFNFTFFLSFGFFVGFRLCRVISRQAQNNGKVRYAISFVVFYQNSSVDFIGF